MRIAVHGKIKERRETRGEWLIGENMQNIPYISIVVTQHETRQRGVECLLMRVKAHKERRRAGAYY